MRVYAPLATALALLVTAPLSASAATSTLQQDVNNLVNAGNTSAVAQTNNNGAITTAVAGATTLGGNTAPDVNSRYRTGSITTTRTTEDK